MTDVTTWARYHRRAGPTPSVSQRSSNSSSRSAIAKRRSSAG